MVRDDGRLQDHVPDPSIGCDRLEGAHGLRALSRVEPVATVSLTLGMPGRPSPMVKAKFQDVVVGRRLTAWKRGSRIYEALRAHLRGSPVRYPRDRNGDFCLAMLDAASKGRQEVSDLDIAHLSRRPLGDVAGTTYGPTKLGIGSESRTTTTTARSWRARLPAES